MKKLSGQITVYAALSLMLVISLVITCIKYARQTQMFAELDMNTRVSVESVFAGFHNKLQQEFDILALSSNQCSDEKMDYYARRNIEGMLNANNIQYISACIEDKQYMTDSDAEGLEKQILAYMKNGIYTDVVSEIMDIEEQTKKSEALNKLTKEVMDLDEQVVALDQSTLKLIELIDGFQTNDGGIAMMNGRPIFIEGSFAKQIIFKDISMDAIAIHHDNIYNAVTSRQERYVNVNKLTEDLMECIDLYKEALEEDKSDADGCAFIYYNHYQQLNAVVQAVKEKSKQAIELIDAYSTGKEKLYEFVDKCESDIKDSLYLLDVEVGNYFMEEVNSLKNADRQAAGLFSIDDLWQNLNDNYTVLSAVKDMLDSIGTYKLENMEKSLLDNLKGQYEDLKKEFQGFYNSKLEIDYSQVCFDNDNQGIGRIKKIKEALSGGIVNLVLADLPFYNGSYHFDNLAESHMKTKQYSKQHYGAQNDVDEGLINQYIADRFECYQDIKEDEHNQENSWCSLCYSLEHIIAGKQSDQENIAEIIMRLSALREGMNIAYIFTDSEKRHEAEAFAISLMGFTGNPAIVKAAQFLIMGVWAYGESLLDIRRLFKGEEISLIKTKEDWKLSLSDLLSLHFDFESIQEKTDNSMTARIKRWSAGRLNYKDYLVLLLMTMNKKVKLFRVMNVMELRMMALGEVDFRMNNYIYQASGKVNVQYGENRLCEKSQQYGYT